MAAVASAPHSRWLLRDSVDKLATSHSRARAAITALSIAATAFRSRPSPARAGLRDRISARLGWPRAIGLGLTTLVTTLFMAWIAVRLMTRLAALPPVAAALPGVLLAIALTVAALHTAQSLDRAASEPALVAAPLAVCAAGVIAWITLWLVRTSNTPGWAAVIVALAVTLTTAVTMVLCGAARRPGDAPPPVGSSAPEGSRRVRARRRRARKRLEAHTRQWMAAAHCYAAVIAMADGPDENLVSLFAGDASLPPKALSPDGAEPFDVMILSGLRQYHPAPLAARLEAALEACR